MLKKIDWAILNTYIENNLIIANKHPEYDIWILNYSPKAQSKKFWNEYTITCRGLIINANGDILARPFQKFKNIEEYKSDEIDMTQEYEIFDKVDGSLIILFYYSKIKKWMVASRGSFISEQILQTIRMINPKLHNILDKKCTYLFEIIYPENRIVVDYGDKKELILLCRIETSTGNELEYNTLYEKYSKYFAIIKKFKIKINNLAELKKLEEENREGFVVRFKNGFRVKIKFNEYIRLQGIVTNVSNIVVWEHLKNNYDFDALLDRVPDEFYDWLKKTVSVLRLNYNESERLALKEFIRIYYINNITDRKEFADEAIESELRSVLFNLYDKKPYDEIIWSLVKPVYIRPFKNDLEIVGNELDL